MIVYTVQPGDSPSLIAKKLTGNPALAWQLVNANPWLRSGLSVGQKLAVPSAWTQYGSLGQSPAERGGRDAGSSYPYPHSGNTSAYYPGQVVGGGDNSYWAGVVARGGQPPPGVMGTGAMGQPATGEPGPWTGRGHTFPGMGPVQTNPHSSRFGVGDANTIASGLNWINAQSDTAPVADTDGTYAGAIVAYKAVGQYAVSQGGVGPDIDATYSSFPGYNNQLTNAAWATNASLQAIQSAGSTLAQAQSAQQVLQQMATYYTQANQLGQQAAAAASGGSGGGGTGPQPGTGTTGADALYQYLQTNGCDCSAQMQSLTKTFQQAAKVTADGYYGTNTQKALQTALTSEWNASGNSGPSPNAPAACYTTSGGKQTGQCTPTKPTPPPTPAACPAGQVNDSVTGKCVAACPSGQIPANGQCIAPVTPPTGTVQASNGPLVAGIILVVLGAGAVTYAVERKKGHRRSARRH